MVATIVNLEVGASVRSKLNTLIGEHNVLNAAGPGGARNYVDLKQSFSAAGDNAADDGPELAAALTSIMASGKTLFVPLGTYLATTWTPLAITGPIRILMEPGAVIKIPGTTQFFASGPATLHEFNVEGGEIDMDAGGRICEWHGHSAGSSVLPLLRLVDVTIRNVINATAPTEASAKNFDCWDSTFDRILIDRVEVTGSQFIGGTICFELWGVQSGTVANNIFRNQTYLACSVNRATTGLTSLHESRSGRVMFTGNRFYDIINTASTTDTHALMLFGAGYSVTANHFGKVQSAVANGNCEGFYSKGQDIQIAGNTFEDSGAQRGMISLKGTDLFDPAPGQQHPEGYGITIVGNTFRLTDAWIASGSPTNPVAIHLEAVGVLIDGNHFFNMSKYRTMTLDSTAFVDGGAIQISNNLFVDCGAGTDSQVLNLSGRATSGNTTLIRVLNNSFTYHTKAGGRIIYFEDATLSTVEVSGNYIEGATTAAIWLRSTGSTNVLAATVRDNAFLNCVVGFQATGVSGTIPLLVHGNNRNLATGAIQESITSPVTNNIDETPGVGGGGGNVSKVGTPVNNQLGIWTGDGTIEGDTDLSWNDTILTVRNVVVTPASAAGPASIKLPEDTDSGTMGIVLTAPAVVATADKAVLFQDVAGTLYVSGGTDVPITDGGTGVSTLPTGLLTGAGTSAITATAIPAGGLAGLTALALKQDDLDVPSQAEAEAGAATTERVWTAQRVGQAIAALAGTNSFGAATPFGAGRTGEVTRTLTGRIQEFVNVQDFGAIATSDDTAVVNAAIAYIHSIHTAPTGFDNSGIGPRRALYFPPGRYNVSSGALTALQPGISVYMAPGAVMAKRNTSTFTGIMWQIGSTTAVNRYCEFYLNIDGYGGGPGNPFTDDTYIGVRLYNPVGCHGFIQARIFTIGCQIISKSTTPGTDLYSNRCNFQFGNMQGRVGLDIVADGDDGAAGINACWHTSSTFRDGFWMGNSVPSTIDQIGVRLRRINGAFTMHTFNFHDLQLDCGTSATNMRTAFEILQDGASGTVGWVNADGLYCENLSTLAIHRGTVPQPHRYEVARPSHTFSGTDFVILEPEATLPSNSTVTALQDMFGRSFTVSATLKRHTVGARFNYAGSGVGVTMTVDAARDGRAYFNCTDATGPLTFAPGTATQINAVTQIPSGMRGYVEWFDRGREYELIVPELVESGLQTAVDAKLPLAGGTIVGPAVLGTSGSISDTGPISATGSLIKATHGGRAVLTTGNVTIPNASGDVGMSGMIILGGAHTVTFNSTVTAALASGDTFCYYVQSTTVLKRTLVPSASQPAMT